MQEIYVRAQEEASKRCEIAEVKNATVLALFMEKHQRVGKDTVKVLKTSSGSDRMKCPVLQSYCLDSKYIKEESHPLIHFIEHTIIQTFLSLGRLNKGMR